MVADNECLKPAGAFESKMLSRRLSEMELYDLLSKEERILSCTSCLYLRK